MSLAVITFEFDPLLHLGDWSVRWETVAIGAAILVGLVVAGLLAPRTRFPGAGDQPADAVEHLRSDDVLFVALGVAPGAVVGGRLAYVALHLDYYAANGGAIVDPGSGGLGLSGAVVLGAITGGIVARLFEAPVGRWYGLAAAPMLLMLALGKAAAVLGGTGQGLPTSIDWATRYLGPGPWGSLGPDVPSHPAQAYEAIGLAVVLAILVVARRLGALRSPDGRAFVFALGGWAAVRLRGRRHLARPARRRPVQGGAGHRPGDRRSGRPALRRARAPGAPGAATRRRRRVAGTRAELAGPGDPSPVLIRRGILGARQIAR